MSICICKNISSHFKCFTTCSSFNKLLHFQYNCISSFSSNSNTDSSIQDSFTVSYLINSCGLSSENALLASRNVKLKTPKKADLVVALFKKHGFTNTQIENVVKEFPAVLAKRPLSLSLSILVLKGFPGVSLLSLLVVHRVF